MSPGQGVIFKCDWQRQVTETLFLGNGQQRKEAFVSTELPLCFGDTFLAGLPARVKTAVICLVARYGHVPTSIRQVNL